MGGCFSTPPPSQAQQRMKDTKKLKALTPRQRHRVKKARQIQQEKYINSVQQKLEATKKKRNPQMSKDREKESLDEKRSPELTPMQGGQDPYDLTQDFKDPELELESRRSPIISQQRLMMEETTSFPFPVLPATDADQLTNYEIKFVNYLLPYFENDDVIFIIVSFLGMVPYQDKDYAHGYEEAHQDTIRAMVMSSTEEFVFTASDDGTVKQWRVENGQCVWTFTHHENRVVCLLLDSEDEYMFSASEDHTVQCTFIEDEECVKKLFCGGVRCMVLSTNDQYLFTGNRDRTLTCWNVNKEKIMQKYRGHTKAVTCCALTSNDNYLISGSADCTLIYWNVHSGSAIRSFSGHSRPVTCCVLTIENDILYSGSEDGTISSWKVITGEKQFDFRGHNGTVNCVFLSEHLVHEKPTLCSGSADGTVKHWSVDYGDEMQSTRLYTKQAPSRELNVVASTLFSRNEYMMTILPDSLQCWNARSQKHVYSICETTKKYDVKGSRSTVFPLNFFNDAALSE